ncbi:MAG: VWA domain-containing protein, partial [Chloroflexi bacterium]|nr:VWA domain-containing protein [Chloroflexota bacterium]
LMLARQLLSRHRLGTRQVIMITDGEPTAHLENGVPFFSYPPSARTIEATLKEVRKCTQEGIVINVFMLEMAYYLVHFIRQLTQINRGRAFFTTPDKLGSYVMVDYLSNKRRAAG